MKINIDTVTAKETGPDPVAARRQLERKIVGQFRDWIRHPGTLDAIYGPDTSCLEKRNKMRSILGINPLTKADIPPGEDWETVWPRRLIGSKERKARQRKILGLPPDDEEPATPSAAQQPTPSDPSNQSIPGIDAGLS